MRGIRDNPFIECIRAHAQRKGETKIMSPENLLREILRSKIVVQGDYAYVTPRDGEATQSIFDAATINHIEFTTSYDPTLANEPILFVFPLVAGDDMTRRA